MSDPDTNKDLAERILVIKISSVRHIQKVRSHLYHEQMLNLN